MKNISTIGTAAAAQRLDVTASSVRRWCEEKGFGFRLMGRWRIPEDRIEELERKLSGAGDEGVSCASGI